MTATSPRAAERSLLLLALVISLGGYVLLGWATSSQIPSGVLGYGGALVAMAALSHLTVARTATNADALFLPSAFLLNGLGLVLVRRVDFAEQSNLAVSQTLWTAIGIGAFIATLWFVRDHRRLTRYGYTFGLITILLLLSPLLPLIGTEVNGSRLWLRVGPISFQPGEIAKLTMVVFLTGYLERKRPLLSAATQRFGPLLLPAPRHLAPVVLASFAALGIVVFQRDLGSGLLFFGVFVTLLYIATGRLAYPAIGLAAFGLGAFGAYHAFGHVRQRFSIWIDPWSQVNDAGYQIAQAQFALGTGGLTGTGLGLGRPDDLPFAATDAVFAVLGEELGLLGATAVLLAFMLLVAKGFRTALVARDDAGVLLAAGLTTILGLQVFVIVGGITRLIPLTGITLPFVSYGGSSLIANYILLALLVRVSHRARTEQAHA